MHHLDAMYLNMYALYQMYLPVCSFASTIYNYVTIYSTAAVSKCIQYTANIQLFAKIAFSIFNFYR